MCSFHRLLTTAVVLGSALSSSLVADDAVAQLTSTVTVQSEPAQLLPLISETTAPAQFEQTSLIKLTEPEVACASAGGSCGCQGGSGCSCGPDCGCDSGLKLFGLDFRSDRCFEEFIEPVTNSVYNMDPRSRSRVRGFFIGQTLPDDSILGGGDYQVWAT